MASPAASPPPPSPPPPPSDASASPSAVKRTRKASLVHVDPATRKADGPHRKKLRTYLGIVARDKVDVTYQNWKEVPTAQKDLIWEDIQPKNTLLRNLKSQRLLTVGRKGSYFRLWARDGGSLNQTSRANGTLQPIRTDVRKKAQAIQKQNTAPHVLSRGGYEYLEQKLLAEKMKKKLEEAAQSGSVDGVIDPPSPVRCHMKWKMARTKKTGEMMTEAAKEIVEKIISHFQLTIRIIFQYFVNAMYNCGSFIPHGRQDVLTAVIGHSEHPGRVCAAGAGVTIKQYFGSAPRMSCSSSSLPPEELQQLTQQIKDQLEESIIEKVTRQLMASFSQMQSHIQSQMQSQGHALPPDPLVGPSGARVSTKGSCVDPSRNDPETGDSNRCGLYIEVDLARLVALGKVYEGSTVVHNTPLLSGQVKVSVEEVIVADAPVLVPTDEVSLVGQALQTFLAWPTHLVKSLSQWDATVFGVFNPDFPLYIKHEDLSEIAHDADAPVPVPTDEVSLVGQAIHTFLAWPTHLAAVSPAKPPQKPDPEVDDLLYLMTLTIPELFLRPYQVTWDATVFGVFNPDFPLYIKHEDLSEIAHVGQCLSILVLQLWILHLT
ncbi:hypothetical protein GmHk_09G025374 [Glycine max]|nr:hypothetical protein GmHk_09G025374 [Glycine max]KAH1232801.1 hypothetical protein GmHk_09G025374 [Glycine max]